MNTNTNTEFEGLDLKGIHAVLSFWGFSIFQGTHKTILTANYFVPCLTYLLYFYKIKTWREFYLGSLGFSNYTNIGLTRHNSICIYGKPNKLLIRIRDNFRTFSSLFFLLINLVKYVLPYNCNNVSQQIAIYL